MLEVVPYPYSARFFGVGKAYYGLISCILWLGYFGVMLVVVPWWYYATIFSSYSSCGFPRTRMLGTFCFLGGLDHLVCCCFSGMDFVFLFVFGIRLE